MTAPVSEAPWGYSREAAQRAAIHAIALRTRGHTSLLREHLDRLRLELGRLGLSDSGLAVWFLTVVFLAPEVALDDPAVAETHAYLRERHGHDGAAAARFFIRQRDITAARVVLGVLLAEDPGSLVAWQLTASCHLASVGADRSFS